MQKLIAVTFVTFVLAATSASVPAADDPIASWSFEKVEGNKTIDAAARVEDTIEGTVKYTPGVRGSALNFDGFTTAIKREAAKAPAVEGNFTIEAWVALGAYPWNWCPIASQSKDRAAGYYFALGPRGQVSLQVALDGKWQICTSEDFVIPLRKWVHVTGTCDQRNGLTLYVDGRQAATLPVSGKLTRAAGVELSIGTNHVIGKPSNIHREHGTRPWWFCIDGIIDELKIYDRAITPAEAGKSFAANEPSAAPDLPPRVMPSGPKGPGRFGAYYCKLKYYEHWDNLWRVNSDPDVIVRFDDFDFRVVFWRGSRYSPAWVSGNGLWMADQSVEAWKHGGEDKEGCFEHMQDRLCRYSHVRIIESTDARVLVHWRYAPVSSYNHLWNVDEKTGRACWIDEYYYIYPDGMGIRNVSWKKGTLGRPRQFQESLPFTHPGQLQCEVIDKDFATIGNFKGDTLSLSYVEDAQRRKKEDIPPEPTIQMYNFKSKDRPFIIFELGNRMTGVRDRDIRGYNAPGSCNHWPVGQARCDGRTSQAADRPTHFLGFPISYPPEHQDADRCWIHSMYGMTHRSVKELAVVGKAWAQAAELKPEGDAFTCDGYEMGQRAYVLWRKADAGDDPLTFTLAASDNSPVFNPALVIENWGTIGDPLLVVDGQKIKRGKNFRFGYRHKLDGTDLIVWIKMQSTKPVKVTITPVDGR